MIDIFPSRHKPINNGITSTWKEFLIMKSQIIRTENLILRKNKRKIFNNMVCITLVWTA